ncbi:hypothetical protein EYF80_011194 [Liparis tanakae]|uniref:Secreted protein n=1 Tax=Liparis tanakae TaxID=230148 RepID=A0A4Z2IKR1_9TELE|nr:hypothetical protein EYF80_011194 [Liparis tanakae]
MSGCCCLASWIAMARAWRGTRGVNARMDHFEVFKKNNKKMHITMIWHFKATRSTSLPELSEEPRSD